MNVRNLGLTSFLDAQKKGGWLKQDVNSKIKILVNCCRYGNKLTQALASHILGIL